MNDTNEMGFPLSSHARGSGCPSRVYPGDAGLDLQAASEATILPGERCVIETGLHVEIPRGYVGFILPRSATPRSTGSPTWTPPA